MTKNVLSTKMDRNDKIKVILIVVAVVVVAIIAVMVGKTFIDVEPPVQPEPPVVRNFPLDDGEDPFRDYGKEVILTPENGEGWELVNVSTEKQGKETLADYLDTKEYQEVVEATTPEVEVVEVESVEDAEQVEENIIVKVENPNKHVHSYIEKVVGPTTTSQGYTEHVCECGDSYVDSFVEALHSHSYTSNVVEATCKNGGYTEHICSCGDSYVDNYTEALGHDFGNNNPTCSHCNESNPSYVEEEMTITNDIDFGAGKWFFRADTICPFFYCFCCFYKIISYNLDMNKTSLFTSLIVIIVLTLAPAIFIGLLEDISLYFSICSYIMLMFMVVFFLMYFIDEKEKAKQIKIKNEEKNKINKYLKINLDDKEVWLVDYENCPYLPKCLGESNSENIACYVFANQTQNERLKNELRNLSTKAFTDVIWTSQKGKNLIDIELSYYTGMINSMYTPTSIYIQSNDRGYETLIKASEDLGIFNIKSFRPLNEVLVADSKCKSIYRQISNETFTNDISLGNFKKKIKKKVLNISADEVNYIVQHLQDTGYISIKENQDGKVVIFEKNKGVK